MVRPCIVSLPGALSLTALCLLASSGASEPSHGSSPEPPAGVRVSDLPRPPQPPPRLDDRAYVEGILRKFAELPELVPPVEYERAKAKVAYYLTFLKLRDGLAASEQQRRVLVDNAAEKERQGLVREAQTLRDQLANLDLQIQSVQRVLAGDASDEDIGRTGSVGIQGTFTALYPQKDGTLRPDRDAELRDRNRAPLRIVVSFAGYSIDPEDPRSFPSGLAPAAAFRTIELVLEDYSSGASPEELASLVEFAQEGFLLQELLQKGEQDELRRILDERWAWILAWGNESGTLEASTTKQPPLARPPLPPPNVGSHEYLQLLMNRFRSVSEEHPYSVEWARAGAKTAWYTSWIVVHNLVATLEQELEGDRSELARLKDFALKADAEALEAHIAEKEDDLADARGALDGRSFHSPRVRQALSRSLGTPQLYIRQSSGVWAPVPFNRPVAALAFLANGFERGEAYQAKRDLQDFQEWALMCSKNCAPEDREGLRAFSREVGECIAALDSKRFDEVVRFYDSRWAWVLEWSADFEDSSANGAAASPQPLEAEPLGRLIGDEDIQAAKRREQNVPKGDALERNRQGLLVDFTRAWQLSQSEPDQPIPFARLREGFPTAFGIGWEDVRAGGRIQKVPAALETIERKLTQWIEATKKDSAGGVPAARQLAKRIQRAGEDYAAERFDAVAEALGELRAWILRGSEFPIH